MCSCIQKVASFQFMGQRINPDMALLRAGSNPMRSSLSFQFRRVIISSGKASMVKGSVFVLPAEQSSLTDVRRGACEVISLLSHTPPSPSHLLPKQTRWLLFLVKNAA